MPSLSTIFAALHKLACGETEAFARKKSKKGKCETPPCATGCIQLTADDAYWLFVNGKLVKTDHDKWWELGTFEGLKWGDTIVVAAQNDKLSAGFISAIQIDGESILTGVAKPALNKDCRHINTWEFAPSANKFCYPIVATKAYSEFLTIPATAWKADVTTQTCAFNSHPWDKNAQWMKLSNAPISAAKWIWSSDTVTNHAPGDLCFFKIHLTKPVCDNKQKKVDRWAAAYKKNNHCGATTKRNEQWQCDNKHKKDEQCDTDLKSDDHCCNKHKKC